MKKNKYQRFFFPLLSRTDPETIHDLTLKVLAFSQNIRPGKAVLNHIAGAIPQKPVKVFGIEFPNVLGVAAGFDKDIVATPGLAHLGFGHIEVGTITPKPQGGNPKPRIFRLPEDGALINRMGFPSGGIQTALDGLKKIPASDRPFVIGVSLGKQKETPLAEALHDYVVVLRAAAPYADYLAINVSSPNTPELRKLQGSKYLDTLIGALVRENESLANETKTTPKPLLLKIAPDLSWKDLDEILQVAVDQQIAGIIATNTTIKRENLANPNRVETGGLSGRPLNKHSLEVIEHITRSTKGDLPVIGVGGIATAGDVKARLDAGAALVQIYTSLIYQGPGLPGQLLRQLED